MEKVPGDSYRLGRAHFEILASRIDRDDFEAGYGNMTLPELTEMFELNLWEVYGLMHEWSIPYKAGPQKRTGGGGARPGPRRRFGTGQKPAAIAPRRDGEIDYDRLADAVVRAIVRLLLEGYAHGRY